MPLPTLNRRRIGLCLALLGLVSLVITAIAFEYLGTGREPFIRAPTAADSTQGGTSQYTDLALYAPRLSGSADPYFGTRQLDYLTRQLESPTYDTDTWRVSTLRQLAFHRLRLGQVGASIDLLSEAVQVSGRASPNGHDHRSTLEELAVAYMKQAEIQNCINPEGRLVCVLPMDPNYFHGDVTSIALAIEILDDLLAVEPDNLRRRWLLNIAHMSAGTFPDGVDERFRISADIFAPEGQLAPFTEVAPDVGLYAVDLAGGAIIEDFDNDGLLDVMTSSWDPSRSLRLYRNVGTGRFVERTEGAGLSQQVGGLNIVQTDYDNDGWKDVLVMRGGWLMSNGQMRMSLLRNGRDGTFSDVTHQSGLAAPSYPSQSASWADFDNDGDLDLFSCNESIPESHEVGAPLIFPSQLFRNSGDGTFVDIAQSAGVTNLRYCKGSAWGDYDNDGDQDLYVSNYADENRLFRNDGNGAFTDVAPDLGLTEPIESFPVWFWDFDNDGWLDLFVAGYARDIDSVAADYLELPNNGPLPRLYRNDGAGGFDDVAVQVGLADVNQAMGSNFGDFDNDGFPDIYLGTGFPAFNALAPNVAYRNDEGTAFQNVTFAAGLGHIQKGHGIAFGDLDRDGDQDIFMQVGGFYPSDGFVNALYVNPGSANNWLTLRLVGTDSNRAAIGARVSVTVKAAQESRVVHAVVNSGGSFGASSLDQEIGLGSAESIESVNVWWPASGIRQSFYSVPMNTAVEITEGDDDYVVIDHTGFSLVP